MDAHRIVEHDGRRWSCQSAGEGRDCLLLLHEVVGDGGMWSEHMTALGETYRVAAPTIPASVDSMEAAVEGLVAILRAEGMPSAHVFGHGQGGLIAQALVRAHPELARSLILSNSAAQATGYPGPAKLPWVLGKWAARRWAEAALRPDAGELTEDRRAFWTGRLATLAAHCPAAIDAPRFGPIEEWKGRVLIFESDGDAFVPAAEAAALRELYPGAILHRFEGAGHFAVFSRVESYVLRMHLFCGGR